MNKCYVCMGGCGGSVTAEEFASGKTTCGAKECPNYLEPFEARDACDACGEVIAEGIAHRCVADDAAADA